MQAGQEFVELQIVANDRGRRRLHRLLDVVFRERRLQSLLGLARLHEHDPHWTAIGAGGRHSGQVVRRLQHDIADGVAGPGTVRTRLPEDLVKRSVVDDLGHARRRPLVIPSRSVSIPNPSPATPSGAAKARY
jgi:hypothetical protein